MLEIVRMTQHAKAKIGTFSRGMLQRIGMERLLDREDRKVREHPACYYQQESLLIPAIQEAPWLLRLPIVRNGNRMTSGYQPEAWDEWVREDAGI